MTMAHFTDYTSHPTELLLAMVADADTAEAEIGPIRTQLACRGVKVRPLADCTCYTCRAERKW